jgi:hypothetical protein
MGASVGDGDLYARVADNFAQHVEQVLSGWHFPETGRVFFDPKAKDLVIAGKPRGSRGKGLRAVTHAAFTIGLLEYCRKNRKPHLGFVVVDSPLLAYRAPEGTDDDLRGKDLLLQFYKYLSRVPETEQVIIIENDPPPADIAELPQVLMFTKHPRHGHYGFFPRIEQDAG